ncbi:MAG: hypothetical protein WA064_05180 [Candidatus Moraniibacteriota bacterium]
MKKFVGYSLASSYVDGSDVRIDKMDGTSVIIIGDSFDISKDPVIGKTRDGADVEIYEADIDNVVRI